VKMSDTTMKGHNSGVAANTVAKFFKS
jgi:hypothetical protein